MDEFDRKALNLFICVMAIVCDDTWCHPSGYTQPRRRNFKVFLFNDAIDSESADAKLPAGAGGVEDEPGWRLR